MGRSLGSIRVALYAAKSLRLETMEDVERTQLPWIAPDDALPEHPSVLWRRKAFPRITPHYRVSSILIVAHLMQLGLGVGVIPLFLAKDLDGLTRIGQEIEEAQTELWLLTHPQSRHLKRVSTVYAPLGETIHLD